MYLNITKWPDRSLGNLKIPNEGFNQPMMRINVIGVTFILDFDRVIIVLRDLTVSLTPSTGNNHKDGGDGFEQYSALISWCRRVTSSFLALPKNPFYSHCRTTPSRRGFRLQANEMKKKAGLSETGLELRIHSQKDHRLVDIYSLLINQLGKRPPLP